MPTPPPLNPDNTVILLHFDASPPVDSSSYQVSLNVSGSIAVVADAGAFAGGLVFANGAANDHLSTDHPAVLNWPAEGPFCINFRFKTTQSNRAYAALLTKNDQNFTPGSFGFFATGATGNGRPEIYLADYHGGAPFLVSANAGYNDGSFHQLRFERDDNFVYTLLIDGQPVASRTWAGSLAERSHPLIIGNDVNFGGRGFVGVIDEFHIEYFSNPYQGYSGVPDGPYTLGGSQEEPAPGPATLSGALVEPSDALSASFENDSGEPPASAIVAIGTLTLPRLKVKGESGASGLLRLPRLKASGQAVLAYAGSGSLSLPALSLSASALTIASARGLLRLPALSLKAHGGGSGSLALPSLRLSGSALLGRLAAGALPLPSLRLSGAAQAPGVLVSARLLLPALAGSPSAQAALSLPALRLLGAAKQLALIDWDAYAINLKHTGDLDPRSGAFTHQVTRFTHFSADQILRHGDDYFKVDPDSVSLLGGPSDNGAPIPWAFKTGLSDFGSRNLKVARQLYVGGRVESGFTATLIPSERDEDSRDYSTPRAGLPRSHRVTLPRGVRSRYFGFGLSSQQGERSEIDELQVEIETTGRSY